MKVCWKKQKLLFRSIRQDGDIANIKRDIANIKGDIDESKRDL